MENDTSLPKTIKDVSIETIRATVRTYLSVLGPFGTAIDEVLFGIGDRIRAKRLEQFVKLLSETLERLDRDKIDEDYLKSEDFYDLTVNMFNSVIKTSSEIKYSILSKIYTESLTEQVRWQSDLTQVFLSYVNDFTENHILIFKYLLYNISRFENLESYEELYNIFSSEMGAEIHDKYEFRMYLRDIESRTLVRFSKDINEYGSSSGYIALEDHQEVQGITLTSLGERFSRYLTSA